MIYNIKKLLWRIQNVLSWIPLLWKLLWYEYDTFYAIMRFTLVKMIRHFKTFHVQYVGIERDIELMELCVKLIDIIKEERYAEQAFDEIKAIWGDLQFMENGDSSYRLKHEKETADNEAECSRQSIEIHNRYQIKHDKASKLLFRILNERLNRWWI